MLPYLMYRSMNPPGHRMMWNRAWEEMAIVRTGEEYLTVNCSLRLWDEERDQVEELVEVMFTNLGFDIDNIELWERIYKTDEERVEAEYRVYQE